MADLSDGRLMGIVRAWRPADRAAVLGLHAELRERERAPRAGRRHDPGMTESYVAALEAALADEGEDGALFVAETADGVVGFLACFVGAGKPGPGTEARVLTVHDLLVPASAGRRGVVRRLLAAARAFAAERGVRRVVVTALAADTLAAAACRAMGFRPVSLVLEVENRAP